MNIDIIIPAYSETGKVYRINSVLIKGRPIIDYTLEAAINAPYIRGIYLITDDSSMLERYGSLKKIKVVMHKHEENGDNIRLKTILSSALKKIKGARPDLAVLLLTSAPLRDAGILESALNYARSFEEYDSIVGVTRSRKSRFGVLNVGANGKTDYSQDRTCISYTGKGQHYTAAVNGALYIVKTNRLGKLNEMLLSSRTYGFEMDEEAGKDIDSSADVAVAEAFLSMKEERFGQHARGRFNVQRLYIHDDRQMGINRNVLDAMAYERHFMRYRKFLKRISASDDVLDIACGSGYGSEILASKARSVTGVDCDPVTIKYAGRHHKKKNINFKTSAIEKFNPKRKFDKIISVETIEHLTDPEGYMKKARGWLKPGGQIWLTCPLSGICRQEIENPFHISEITYEMLKRIMRKYFKTTSFYRLSGKKIFSGDTLNNKTAYIVAKGAL